MSVSAISNGLSTIGSSTQSVHTNLKQFQQEFLQLGSDLQSGNLTAAKQDYLSLHSLAGEGGDVSSGPVTQGSNALVDEFNQLGKDLVSGNVSGAQQVYGNLKQDFQKIDTEHNNVRSHVHGFGETDPPSPAPVGPASPADPGGLASSTSSTTLSSVQMAYASMLQGLQDFGSEALTPAMLSSTSISA